jgi:hypothetical protein
MWFERGATLSTHEVGNWLQGLLRVTGSGAARWQQCEQYICF